MTPAETISGVVVAGPVSGRSRAGRPRATAVVEDAWSRRAWLVNAYTTDARAALIAIALGEEVTVTGRADSARRVLDAGRVAAVSASPCGATPASGEGG